MRSDLARHDLDRHGGARQRYSCRRQHRGLTLPLLLSQGSRKGLERLGKVRQDKVRSGLVIAADGSTGAFGLLCCSRKGVVMVRQVLVGHGKARLGHAWRGRVSGALRRPFKLKIQLAL